MSESIAKINIDKNFKLDKNFTAFDLKIVSIKIPIKYCEYKITNTNKNMLSTECKGISEKGILFASETPFDSGKLIRAWVIIPNYWAKKSQRVEYRHTEIPLHFQILARVVSCDHTENNQYDILCENLSVEDIDIAILKDYLESSTGDKK